MDLTLLLIAIGLIAAVLVVTYVGVLWWHLRWWEYQQEWRRSLKASPDD